MNVRVKREGVEEVFSPSRVSKIMQQALAKRYPSPPCMSSISRGHENAVAHSSNEEGCTAQAQRLRIPLHYTLRRHSRTEHFLFSHQALCTSSHPAGLCAGTCAPRSLSSSVLTNEGRGCAYWWCEEEACVARTVVAECLRHHSFNLLTQTDLRRVCGLQSASRQRENSIREDTPLASWQEFFELPPRWVMQSLGAVDRHVFASAAAWRTRRSVTPLDVGAVVVRRDDPALNTSSAAPAVTKTEPSTGTSRFASAVHYRVVAAASMSRGAYWVDIAPMETSATNSQQQEVERVDREALWLDPPTALHVDPLLPCDELYSDRGASTSTYVFFLRALQQRHQRRVKRTKIEVDGSSSNIDRYSNCSLLSCGSHHADLPTLAADLSLRLARCARQRREELTDSFQRWLSSSTSSRVGGTAIAITAGEQTEKIRCTKRQSVLLQVRVDATRDCLELRALWTGDDVEMGDTKDNGNQNTSAGLSGKKNVSPTVEVLLRSARKLAVLYDMTRAASLSSQVQPKETKEKLQCTVEHKDRHDVEEDVGNSHGHDRDSTTSLTYVASAVLNRLILDAAGDCKAVADTPDVAEVTAPSSTWHDVIFDHSEGVSCEQQPPTNTIAEDVPGKAFLARLFVLLLRYRSLFGEQGYNQGPQAAVPPPIMEQLAHTFDIRAEAFASPLNVQLPQFGSLFPDTDAYFGSVGSFFDLVFGSSNDDNDTATSSPSPSARLAPGEGNRAVPLASAEGCHVEVNPPFDTTLLRHMEEHLINCLHRSDASAQSLLFLIVLPSHDLDASEKECSAQCASIPSRGATPSAQHRIASSLITTTTVAAAPVSTDRSLRESPYCLGHVLCRAAEAVYVDGHQHLLESPFFCIGTPTRLILLGNAAARARFPSAVSQLEGVRLSWKKLTESAWREE